MVFRGSIFPVILAAFSATSLSSNTAFAVPSIARPNRSDLFELSVIHLNDFHARFLQTSPNSDKCLESSEDECVGGIARIYTESRRLLNERPNAIFLNAGDNFQGTIWYTLYRWNVTVQFLNMLSEDAMTLGNHDFDNSIPGLVPFLKNIKTPVLMTNIDVSEEPEMNGLFTNSTVIERNGTKIGIIGVITSNTKILANTRNIKFLDEVVTVNAEAEKLKQQGIKIIIVLSHVGIEMDKVIATSCPNVDLIVGGHSHAFLYSGTPPSLDVPVDKYPIVVRQSESNNRVILIVQAGAFTKYLGNLTVWFNETGEVVDWEGNPILLNNSVEQDPGVLAALVQWQVPLEAFASTVIGFTNVVLNNDCLQGECNLGNFITDAMVDSWVNKTENSSYWTYASVACTSGGGIHVQSLNTKGNITYGDTTYHQPYEYTWDVVELRGSDLIQVLEYSVVDSYSSSIFIGVRFLQWSGIKVIFNLENEAYSRVVNLKIRCQDCQMPVYEDVVMDKWYRIVMPHPLVKGLDGYTVIKYRHRNHEIGVLNTDYYPKYIEKRSPINIGVEGRITFRGRWRG